MKNLKETVELMTSEDYKERFKAEYWQTKIRYEKLKDFCNRIDAAGYVLDNNIVREPEHDCPLWLLRKQQKQMGKYLSSLEMRAIIEHVDLNGEGEA